MSAKSRVLEGSKDVFLWAVYSEIRRNPKKAVVMAAQIMTLSSNKREELNKFWLIILSREGVIGSLLGME